MEFTKGLDFSKLKHGTIVESVPCYHELFDPVREYIKDRRNREAWRRQRQEMEKNFNKLLAGPFYYCQKCRRIEDGANRFDLLAIVKGEKKVDIHIGPMCWKGLARDLLNVFRRRLENVTNRNTRDIDWLEANALEKWPHFKEIDFKGKNILDVGTQTGFTCFNAIKYGAEGVIGIDVRGEVLQVGKDIAKDLGFSRKIKLTKKSILDYESTSQFDIVFCLGLIHYFEPSDYIKVFNKLCSLSSDYLILDLRIEPESQADNLFAVVKQTLATPKWLNENLKRSGFVLEKKIRRGHRREMWISRRFE